jgi:hypothetical protein
MLESLGTNPTQLLGLVAFASATIACIFAKRNSPNESWAWTALAITNATFFFEIIFGIRHRLHDVAVSLLLSAGLYEGRADLQYVLIFVSAAVLLFMALLFLFLRRVRKPGLSIATVASLTILSLFVLEAISLHRIDQIFYQKIGPILLVGWLWCIACVAIVLSTLL